MTRPRDLHFLPLALLLCMKRREHIVLLGEIAFEMTDDTGHTIIVSPELAYERLNWLYDQRPELHQAATRDDEPTPEHKAEVRPVWVLDNDNYEPM